LLLDPEIPSAASRSNEFQGNARVHLNLDSTAYLKTWSTSLPTMGNNGIGVRDESRVEQFARRVHREGLPIARLWENDQALVSLGLNQKGKPGLWLMQKVP
jgi:hypothetical protein